MITPLHKHRGQHGGLIAFGLLVASTAVVWVTHPAPKRETVTETTPKPLVAPAVAAAATVAREAAPAKPAGIEGVITYDEQRTSYIGAPVNGWVTSYKPGKRVKAGETIGTLYSVDVVMAQRALVDQIEQFTTQDLLDAERRRLLRWGMRQAAILRVEKTKQVGGALPIIAPRDGTLVVKPAVPGMFVEPGHALFTITDPSRAWVIIDTADVAVGTQAKLTIAGKSVVAKVTAVYPRLDKARFDLVGNFTPGTPVQVELK